ncbi:unnamed protein product, partial [Closterium sp. Naga37s-1]
VRRKWATLPHSHLHPQPLSKPAVDQEYCPGFLVESLSPSYEDFRETHLPQGAEEVSPRYQTYNFWKSTSR